MTETAQNIQIVPTKEDLAQAACNHFIDLANQTIQKKGRFSIALAGGSTPAFFYALLAKNSHDIRDWENIHFFWEDERCVPPDHKDSNYFLAKHTLFSQIRIPANNIHRILTEILPEQAAHTEKKRWVVWVPHRKPPAPMVTRVSLTLPIINTASQVTFLVSGEEKAQILDHIFSTDATFQETLPAAKVHPHQGELLWLIDSDAASKL